MGGASVIALAPQGVFWTIQGEGHLSGKGMVFVRLAGCSLGCAWCDTDYSVAGRTTPILLSAAVAEKFPAGVTDRWVWITGGEPTDQPELDALVQQLTKCGYAVAVATNGAKRVLAPVSWLSVSPHAPDFAQRYGNEVKIVPGLNGHGVSELCAAADRGDFWERFVMPLWDAKAEREDPASLRECLDWVRLNPRWGITRQNHKAWGLA
jgi:7-carboxy-7-deazaguanine synthase